MKLEAKLELYRIPTLYILNKRYGIKFKNLETTDEKLYKYIVYILCNFLRNSTNPLTRKTDGMVSEEYKEQGTIEDFLVNNIDIYFTKKSEPTESKTTYTLEAF